MGDSKSFSLHVRDTEDFERAVDITGSVSTKEGLPGTPAVSVRTVETSFIDGAVTVSRAVEVGFPSGAISVDVLNDVSTLSLHRGPFDVAFGTTGNLAIGLSTEINNKTSVGVHTSIDVPAVGRNITVFGNFVENIVNGLHTFIDVSLKNGKNPFTAEVHTRCFTGDTKILLASGEHKAIKDIELSDTVASFDGEHNNGRGDISGRPVVRLYHNVTQEFIRLDFNDGHDPIHVTPGHAFLDETGSFTKIGDMLRLGGNTARLIDETGEVVTVSATWLRYSAETADMFERSQIKTMTSNGSVAFKENVIEGWKTYNFEVEDYHTYVANGIRVHNESGVLGQIGDTLDNGFFDRLGNVGDAIGDVVNGGFHAAGQIVGGVVNAVNAIGTGFTNAAQEFSQGNVFGGIAEIGRGIGNAIGEVARGIGNAIGEVARGIGNAIGSVFGKRDDNDGEGNDRGKPIIIDMDGDGIEIAVDSNVMFDMDEDGFLEDTAWVHQDDAFLVLDLNADGTRGAGDGKIDQTKELVLSKWLEWDGATDLQALATFDQSAERGGNNDGVLSAQDTIWSELRIWQDSNSNGVADAGELKTLNQLGFSQINLAYDDGTDYANMDNDVSIYNNSLLGSASYIRNGETVVGGVGDVALSYGAKGVKKTDTSYGFDIELETGGIRSLSNANGKASANYDLTSTGRDGAYGDHRANILDAHNSNKEVYLEGKAGDDTLIGGNKDDQIIGGSGADILRGGLGDDTYIYEQGNGHDVIDNSVFQVTEAGVVDTATGGEGFTHTFTAGKGITSKWTQDTRSGAVVEILDSGNDTLLFGSDISIADLVLSDSEATYTSIWPSQKNHLEMKIEFADDTGNIDQGNSIRVENWGTDKFRIDTFEFSTKFKIDVGHVVNAEKGTQQDDVIDLNVIKNGANGILDSSWLSGLDGNDTIRGSGYGDFINGGQGNDVLTAGLSNAGSHNVTITPNIRDVFIFKGDDGHDIITDFSAEDIILLDIGLTSFEELDIVNSAQGAVITYDTDDTITLNGVAAEQLTADEFVFV